MWEQPLIGWSRCRTGGGATARWVWGRDKRKTKPEVSALSLLSFDQSAQIRYVLTFLSQWPGKQWIKNDLNGTRRPLVWFMAPQMDFVLSILCNLLCSLRSSHSPSFLLCRDYLDCAQLDESNRIKLLAELWRMAPCWPLRRFFGSWRPVVSLFLLRKKYKWTKPQMTQMTSQFSSSATLLFSRSLTTQSIIVFPSSLISTHKLCSLPPSSLRKSKFFSFFFFFFPSPYGCICQPFCTHHQNTSGCCLWLSLAALPGLCVRGDMQIGILFFFLQGCVWTGRVVGKLDQCTIRARGGEESSRNDCITL